MSCHISCCFPLNKKKALLKVNPINTSIINTVSNYFSIQIYIEFSNSNAKTPLNTKHVLHEKEIYLHQKTKTQTPPPKQLPS